MNASAITQTTNANDWLAGVKDLSAVSQEVAINRPLAELVEITLTAAANKSANTARAYQTSIGLFLQFMSEKEVERLPADWQPLAIPTKEPNGNGKSLKTVWEFRGYGAALRLVTAGLRDSFVAWLADQGNSQATQNQRVNAVNTFLRVCLRDGVLSKDQADALGIKPYKQRQKRNKQIVGRRLKADEVRKLQAIVDLTARNDTKAARDKAILDLMLYAGLRRSEIAGAKNINGEWNILPLAPNSFVQDGGRWWIEITGKGKKPRKLKIHDALYKRLVAWLAITGQTLGDGDKPLFYNLTKGGKSTGKVLNPGVIGRIVAEYGAAAGLAPRAGKNRLSPHDLRRTCARNAYDNGASLLKVQSMLGHSDPKTTAEYIGAYNGGNDTAIDHITYEPQGG